MTIQLRCFRRCVSEFEFEDGQGIGAVIVCDVCGDLIREAGLGVCVHPTDRLEIGESQKPFFAHKGKCHNQLERDFGYDPHNGPWDELTSFLAQLRRNTGFDESGP